MLREAIYEASELDTLIALSRELRDEAQQRVRRGESAAAVSQFISGANDALCARVIDLERAAALPGVDVCWIVMGSQGRREQTLHTDQDNAIVFDGAADPARVRSALVAAARRVNEYLDACGIPRCRGGIMGGNPKWCLSIAEWRSQFADWMDRGDPQALLNAVIFFDFRPVAGAAAVGDALRAWLGERARDHTRFLFQLTLAALENRPPLGMLGRFVLATHGGVPHTLDLKVNAVTPFVDAARILGLASDAHATGTRERLSHAASCGQLARAQADACAEAFEDVQRLRLKVQALALDARGEGGNIVDPARLTPEDRGVIKRAMREALALQRCVARRFGAGAGGFGA